MSATHDCRALGSNRDHRQVGDRGDDRRRDVGPIRLPSVISVTVADVAEVSR